MPNCFFARRRTNALRQIRNVLDRHAGESGIIYCIRRADVDAIARNLAAQGYRAAPHHAGMTDEERKKNQNAFIHEEYGGAVMGLGRSATEEKVYCPATGVGLNFDNIGYHIGTMNDYLPGRVHHQ